MNNGLDAYGRPPELIKSVYKRYQKLTPEAVQSDPTILDFHWGLSDKQQCSIPKVASVSRSSIVAACTYLGLAEAHEDMQLSTHASVYETDAVPGEPSKVWNCGRSYSL